jgi:hypothetical protein
LLPGEYASPVVVTSIIRGHGQYGGATVLPAQLLLLLLPDPDQTCCCCCRDLLPLLLPLLLLPDLFCGSGWRNAGHDRAATRAVIR